jgi:hypothetical protein
MDKLVDDLRSDVFPDKPSKRLYLCTGSSIDSLGSEIKSSSKHFGLFLALDAQHLDTKKIGQVAEESLKSGLAYLCVWGPDCERVHDIFDEVDVELDADQTKPVVMTTWHSDESLEDALSFFLHSAFPDEAYEKTCLDWIIAPIGPPDWEQSIRNYFKRLDRL